ncbi:MAG: thiol peroxidase [Flavobacteriaceae bacterium]|nr:thiol peroxidase [Flavobacteriaceae bacterium]
MAKVTLQGTPLNTKGSLPNIDSTAPNFSLTANDLSKVELIDFRGTKIVLNIFPSIDTGTCAQSVREFNKQASALKHTKVLCISKDLPFAQARFCGAEDLNNVISLSDYKTGEFGSDYGLTFIDGPLETLHSRCVIIIDEDGVIRYTEQVAEIADEPNYRLALEALQNE